MSALNFHTLVTLTKPRTWCKSSDAHRTEEENLWNWKNSLFLSQIICILITFLFFLKPQMVLIMSDWANVANFLLSWSDWCHRRFSVQYRWNLRRKKNFIHHLLSFIQWMFYKSQRKIWWNVTTLITLTKKCKFYFRNSSTFWNRSASFWVSCVRTWLA